jgi:ubiquitin-protein ligase E3 C
LKQQLFYVVIFCQIRVTFVNELGVEEAGVDGGGIFKDFMENVTKVAFAIQYGLFKV